jgi:L-glutamine-phosphate cytidylyltransferase
MRAVILAAGRGGRLRGVTGGQPKCLARVGSESLIERQLRALADAGVSSITVVVGHEAASVRRTCGTGVDFVHNARYASTNSLYSLWLARHLLTEPFVVLNADVLFHPQLLIDLLTARYEDALLMAARPVEHDYSEEEMKLRVRAGRVVEIGKALPADEADGENIGIAKFGESGARLLRHEIEALVGAGATNEWLPAAFAAFAARRALHVVESRGFPWIEIDFPEDYWRACSEVLPAIDAPSTPLRTRPAAASTAVGGSHV